MLEVNKNITVNGISKIEGVQVVYMSATIATDGSSNANIVKTVTNQEIYNANKTDVRKDMADFENIVYGIQDSMNGGNE